MKLPGFGAEASLGPTRGAYRARADSIFPLRAGLVSHRKPDGLILSTGNLYFTSHDAATAAVWRMAQSSSPGQEILLYSEPGARFGDIVFAQVDGIWWGYFFATSAGVPTATIKRVPLTGGAATVVGTVTDVDVASSHRNLVTDGVNLYWQDVESVRKMPISGGPITILDQARPNTPTAGLALQNGNLIYASVKDIRFVPTSGAITSPLVRTIARASSRVSTLNAVASGVSWGESSGAVRIKVGPTIRTLPSSNLVPTSISANGFRSGTVQAWTQCASQSCRLHVNFRRAFLPDFALSRPIAADALGATVTPAGSVFWGDALGVHRAVF